MKRRTPGATSSLPYVEPGVEKFEEMNRVGGVTGLVTSSDLDSPRREEPSLAIVGRFGDRGGDAINGHRRRRPFKKHIIQCVCPRDYATRPDTLLTLLRRLVPWRQRT